MDELIKAFRTIKEYCDMQHCDYCPLYLKTYDEEEHTMCMVDRLPCSLDIDDISMKLKSGES